MDSEFRHSVFGHIFRRYLKKSVEPNEVHEIFFWIQFKRMMSRLAFLSEASAETMQAYIDGMFIVPAFNGADNFYINASIPSWHISKRLSIQQDISYMVLYFEIPSIKILFDVVKPTGVELHLQFGQKLPKWVMKLCEYSRIMYLQPMSHFATETQKKKVLAIKKHANLLTEILYFDKFHRYLKGVDFPQAQTIRFHSEKPITVDFLKLWQKSNWNIKTMTFVPFPENLDAFKKVETASSLFSCCFSKSSERDFIISKTVTDVQIPFDTKGDRTYEQQFEVVCKGLEILKKAFPSLVNVTGTIFEVVDHRRLMLFIEESFPETLYCFVVTVGEAFRIQWCQRLRLVISIILPVGRYTAIPYKAFIEELKCQVQYCRESMPFLTYIHDPVPGVETFDHYPTRSCLAIVQAGTAYADFQFSFKVARDPNS